MHVELEGQSTLEAHEVFNCRVVIRKKSKSMTQFVINNKIWIMGNIMIKNKRERNEQEQSILFNMSKRPRGLYCLLKPLTVLHMTGIVADPTIKNILKGILAQKLVAQNPHASGIFEVYPEISEVGYSVDIFLFFGELAEQIVILDPVIIQYLLEMISLFLNICYYGLSVVLGDVFRLVFYHCPDLIFTWRIFGLFDLYRYFFYFYLFLLFLDWFGIWLQFNLILFWKFRTIVRVSLHEIIGTCPADSEIEGIIFGAVRLIGCENGQTVEIHLFLLSWRLHFNLRICSHRRGIIKKIHTMIIGVIANITQTTEQAIFLHLVRQKIIFQHN